jgi:thioredoxin-related protein
MHKRFLVGWVMPAVLLFGTGLLGAIRGDRPGGDIPWVSDFRGAATLARRTHRPLLLSFHTPGCGWCAKLDAETFTDKRVVELSERYVCVRLDSDVDSALCGRYFVLDYPTTLLLDPEGRELAHLTGFIPPERFAPALSAALNACRIPAIAGR